MARRMISFAAVMIMLLSSFIIVASEGTEAASTAPVTVHPIPDNNNLPWVTSSAIPYISNFTIYFEEDPYDEAVKFFNGEITMDQLKSRCGYIGESPSGYDRYYSISHYDYGGGSSTSWYFHDGSHVSVMSPFQLFFEDDPRSEIEKYVKKEITLQQLKTRCGYTESESRDPGTTYYMAEYTAGMGSVSIYYGLDYNSSVYFYSCYPTWYFSSDPKDDLVRFVNYEITFDELKSRCGYVENPSMSERSRYYQVYCSNDELFINMDSNKRIPFSSANIHPEAYFTEDPYDEVVKYLNDEMDLATLKTKCGYTIESARVEGSSYYYVSISGGGNTYYEGSKEVEYKGLRYINISPKYLFLDKGKYHISITNTDLRSVEIKTLSPHSYFNSINTEDGSGSTDITISSQEAIWFTGYFQRDTYSLSDTWREKKITYTLDPAPSSGTTRADFDRSVKVLSDMEWIKMTTVDTLTGYYSTQSPYDLMFISGSDEEKAFIENVIDKQLVDASGYGNRNIDVTGEKLTIYRCRSTSSDLPRTIWLSKTVEKATSTEYESKAYECRSEKLSVSDVGPFKFYANYDFSISVKYDTDKVKAVVMICPNGMGGTNYSVLESGRVYDFHMISSGEYELYAMPSSSSGTLAPTQIGIYTENVGTSDSNGTIFAGVAIALCVLAFGTLFLAGRRPKWGDLEGLPSADTEVVHHEVPADVPEENIPEEVPAEGQPKE